MRPAELVALYAAHGIDLAHVAGSASDTKGVARKRRMGPEERKRANGRPITETVEGTGTRVMRPRAWSHAELGICAGGLVVGDDGKPVKGKDGRYLLRMARMAWLAACYSWGGDRDGYKELHRALTAVGLKLMQDRNWPWKIRFVDGREDYYLERLTELVLDIEGCPAHFTEAAKNLLAWSPQAIYLGVEEKTWQKPVYAYFLELQGKYQSWLDDARGTIGQWLKPEPLHEPQERATVAPEPSNAA